MTNPIIETKPMTCIICPMGCTMEVTLEKSETETKIIKVVDNNCPRGPEYVKKELLNPTRTLTTTITVIGGKENLVPVKTAGEVPRNLLTDCMEIIRRVTCTAPIVTGQVLIQDILGTGINVVSCFNIDKK